MGLKRGVAVTSSILLLATIALFVGAGGVAADEPVVSDNESIQDAIDESEPGDTIVVEEGTYEEELTVDVDELTLRAADGTEPVLDGSDHDGVGVNISAADVTIEGLTVVEYGKEGVLVDGVPNATVAGVNASHNGWPAEGEPQSAGINVRAAPDGTVIDSIGVDNGLQAVRVEEGSNGTAIENVTAIDNDRSGIWAGSTDEIRIANSTGIDNGLRAIHVEAIDQGSVVTEAEVIDNEAIDNAQSGILMVRTEDAVVQNNTVEGFDHRDHAGITVDGAATDVHVVDNHLKDGYRGVFVGTDGSTIENNVVDDVNRGIEASGSEGVTIDGDRVSDVRTVGIWSASGTESTTIKNATVEDADTGIRLSGADHSTVERNEITGANTGIYQINSSTVSVLQNEILESDTGYELRLDNDGTIAEKNTIAHGGDGVEDGGENGITLIRNEIVHNSRDGVTIGDNLIVSDPVVSANNISSNRVGIRDIGTDGAVITDNHVQTNRDSGIELAARAENANVANNTVLENHHELGSWRDIEPGILIGAVENVTVTGNTVEENDEQGIAVEDDALEIHLDGNELADQPVDVLLLASDVTLTNNTVERGIDVPERGFLPEDFVVHGTDNTFSDGAALDILTGDEAETIDPDARQVLITGVSDETLTAGGHGTEKVPFGLFVSASENLTVADATVEDAADTGIRVAQVESTTLTGLDADGDDRAVLLEDAEEVTVADVTLYDTAAAGLEAVETPGLAIENLSAEQTTATAIDVRGSPELSMSNTTVDDFDPAIGQDRAVEIDGATNGELRDIRVSESTSRALHVSDSDAITLESVTVERADQGVWLDAVGATVHESAFLDSEEWGLRTSDAPDGVIKNSTVTGNDEEGLIVRGDNLTVTNNDVTDNKYGVVVDFEWEDVILEHNHIEGNTEYGLQYDRDWPDHNVTATNNYWGAENGPSGDVEDPETETKANGDGDRVDENVLFDPWLDGPAEEEEYGTLEGTVTSETDGEPIKGVTVTATPSAADSTDLDDPTSVVAVTDPDGTYEFDSLTPDTYDLEVSAVGYETEYRDDVTVEAGETTTVDVELTNQIAQYADDDGTVQTDGLREAIGDWRADDIDTDLLQAVIDVWRSDDQVA